MSRKQSGNRRNFIKYAAGAAVSGTLMLSCAAPTNKTRTQSSLKHPVFDTVDVLVVGGGPAGIGAALGAARAGAKVLLIENQSFFGGVGAWCVGMPINQMRPMGKPRSKVHELVITKLLALGEQACRINQHQLLCNVDYLKVAVADALDETGCRYLVATRAVDAIVEGNRVAGVVITTKNGLMTIKANVVIDCTGDADIAYFAGAETMKETGNLSPMTLCLSVTNVDKEKLNQVNIKELVRKAKGKYPLIPPEWGLVQIDHSHSYVINHAGTRAFAGLTLDATDAAMRTRAECMSRRQVLQMIDAMREFGGEALKDVELTGTGTQVGVRETRRVKGLYVLTEADAKNGARFKDVIAWRSGYLDIGFVRFEQMKIHDVPYRAIVPEKIYGLLTAGRCISATHEAASAGKSMGNCIAVGHAAGIAAAMASKNHCQPRDVDVAKLQDALRAEGVDLEIGAREQSGTMPT
jgi:ribulose 1,5-bisphosphate synthetase/thiazole synthase